MISCSSLKAIPKGSDLSAVFALMPIVHIDKHVIQGILHAILGQCSGVAEHFRANPLSQAHHLRVSIIEFAQNLTLWSPPSPGHRGIFHTASPLGNLRPR